MILSQEQLREITGKVRWSAQCRALAQMGIHHFVRPDGKPIVEESALRPDKSERTVEGPRLDGI